MRKLIVLALGTGLVLALGAPAVARPFIARNRSTSAGANAFWYDIEWLSDTRYHLTVWYAGVYRSSDFTFSDVYHAEEECEVLEGEEYDEVVCTPITFGYGESNLSDGTFRIDRRLRTAVLDATFDIQWYSADGSPLGAPVATDVEIGWTGLGRASRSSSSWSDGSGCTRFMGRFRGLNRSAEADGEIGGTELGETSDAYLGTSSSMTLERIC